jgi:hypothetical protein
VITSTQEHQIVRHLAKTPWLYVMSKVLEHSLEACADDERRERASAVVYLWCFMCSEIGIDWPDACEGSYDARVMHQMVTRAQHLADHGHLLS